MPDLLASVRKGEAEPIYGSVKADSGTITISGPPTATLLDSTGSPISGYPQHVTGYDSSAAATVRAWLELDTSALDPGVYTLAFTIVVVGSDDLTRTYYPVVSVVAGPVLDGPDYTAWPQVWDVLDRIQAAGVTLRAAVSGRRIQAVIDAVTTEVFRR